MAHFNFNCLLLPCSNGEEDVGKEEFVQELQDDIVVWFRCYRISKVDVANYYREQRCRIRRFLFARNEHVFMLDAMKCSLENLTQNSGCILQCYAYTLRRLQAA